jgi:LuxR family maltose regulon positive regulatory protein
MELMQGRLDAALRWAHASGLSLIDKNLNYSQEQVYLTFARVRIAQAREQAATSLLPDVLSLLDRLLADAERKARTSSVLEILIVQALALQAQHDRARALTTLQRALVLAEPEGYLRLFVDEGVPMRELLRKFRFRRITPSYIAALLAAFGEAGEDASVSSASSSGLLIEPLTAREHEVLRLLAEGASNREIARRLVLSPGTVKKYVYTICGKLGVQSRTQALVRARALHLL